MASDEWRWADPKGQQRLLRTEDLRKALSGGTIPPNVPVWRRGWTSWKPADQVPELMESALASENGTSGKLAPPPSFVVAAQTELESTTEQDGPNEPPPPPKYVPAPTVKKAEPSHKPPPLPAGSAKPPPVTTAKPAPVTTAKPPPVTTAKPAPAPSAKPPAVSPSRTPPPLPVASAKPPPVVSPVATSAKPPPLPAKKESVRPEAIDAGWGDDPKKRSDLPPPVPQQSLPTFMGVPALPNIPRATLPVSPAPPPIPQQAPIPQAPRSPPPPYPPAGPPGIQKHATLIGLESPMLPAVEPPPASVSAPIFAPAPSTSSPQTPNAVTQPPPWEGSAEVQMPKIPPSGLPKLTAPVEELSGSILLEDSQAGPMPKPREVELSSSDLLERESAVSVVKAAPLGVGAKASTLLGLSPAPVAVRAEPTHPETKTPSAAPEPKPASRPPEPEPTQVSPRGFDLRALQSTAQKEIRALLEGPRQRLYVVGGVVAFVVLLFVGVLIRLVAGGASEEEAGPIASASASASSPASARTLPTQSAPPVVSSAPVTPPAKLASCSVSGDAHVVSPHALIQAGVEVAPVGDAVGLGFASGPKEAMVATLDPATIAATSTNKIGVANPVRRVTPGDKAIVDSDSKTDAIQGRRAVAAFDVGAVNGELVWAPHGSSSTTKLWALEADAAAEAIRGVATSDGIAVAYRHNGAIFVGAAKGEKLDAYGAPNKIPGLGTQVGSPTIAYGEGNVLVAWADRVATSDPWGVRILAWHPGDAPKAAKSFAVPAGGLGEHAMAPGLSALSGGKFLLVWTEGPVSSHQVRAQVLDPDGSPSGAAMTVSAEGVNAGQGQAAVLADGRGVVAFLAGSGKTFEVRATPIRCK